jgi:disulfide oxidoreductase YuzD
MSRLYGSVNINVDVDLSDIYDDMSRSQKTEFADKLQDEGYFEEEDTDDEYALSTGISRIKNDEWSSSLTLSSPFAAKAICSSLIIGC